MSGLTYPSPIAYISFTHDSPQHTRMVFELATRLTKDGITCINRHFLSSHGHFLPGGIRKCISEADFILVVCSGDYYRRIRGTSPSNSKWRVEWEGELILEHLQKSAADSMRFIPVIFDQRDVAFIFEPLKPDHYYLINTPESYSNLFRDLTAHLALDEQQTKPQHSATSKGQLELELNLWNVPYDRNPFFTGREELLARLHQDLARPSDAIRSQVLFGLGGVGKTQIAAEYAYRHRKDYSATYWIRAESPTVLSTSILEAARLMGFTEQDNTEPDDAFDIVKDWLESHPDWLMIFDNADDLSLIGRMRLSSAKGSILLTSRTQIFDSIGIFRPIEVEKMGPEDSVRFLLKRTDREKIDELEAHAAAQIAQELGHLPLALEQAGAFIKEKQARFQDFLQSYLRRRIELLAKAAPVAGSHPESVVTTWSINLNEVERNSSAASELLCVISFFHPDKIPTDILVKGAAKLSPAIAASLRDAHDDPLIVDDALAPLLKYSLIRRDINTHTFSIHRLVQEVLRSEMDSDTQKYWATCAVCALAEACPSPDFRDWPSWDLFLPHAQAAADLIEKMGFSFMEAGKLLYQLAIYYHERGLFREAESFYTRSAEIWRKALDIDDLILASCLDNLGELYRVQGNFDNAAPLYKEALDIRRKALDENNPDVALSLNHLGLIYTARGEYIQAEPLFKQSLRIREISLGESDLSVAGSVNNLGFLYYMLGRYPEAKQLHERALGIRERILGKAHPYVARSLNNLALVYMATGNIQEAKSLHERALAIRRDALGSEHPDVAASLNNLATVYRETGDYLTAYQLYSESMKIRIERVGEDHPDFASCLHNIAVHYWLQDDVNDAEPLFMQALDIRERKLGVEHPYVAYTCYYLGSLKTAQGHFAEAEDYYSRALSIFRNSLGDKHPEVARTRESFISLLRQMGRDTDADAMS